MWPCADFGRRPGLALFFVYCGPEVLGLLGRLALAPRALGMMFVGWGLHAGLTWWIYAAA